MRGLRSRWREEGMMVDRDDPICARVSFCFRNVFQCIQYYSQFGKASNVMLIDLPLISISHDFLVFSSILIL